MSRILFFPLALAALLCAAATASAQTPVEIVVPAGSVTASAHDGNVPGNTVDKNFATRWSAKGDGQWIRYDLGTTRTVSYARLAWHQGNQRTSSFDLQVSANGSGWSTIFSGTSSGTTTGRETYHFDDVPARYVRVVGRGNSSGNGWNSITEAEIFGLPATGPGQVAAPVFDPGGGQYASAQSVAITTSTGGASIRYTTNGASPSSTTGTPYSGPVAVPSSVTLKAIAFKSGMADSAVASANYAIGGESPLDPDAPPGENFDLSKWKITLPINDAEEHSAAELVAGYEHPDWFFTDPATGGMVFRAPNRGDTTGGSSYTRSELREMLAPGGSASAAGNNWVLGTSSSSARNAAGGVDGTLRAVLTVDRVSTTGESGKVGRVIVGQIHAPDTEIIRLYYHKRPGDSRGAIYFANDDIDNEDTFYPIIGDRNNLNPADGIALGELWSYEIRTVGRTMTVKITPEGRPTVTKTFQIQADYNDLSNYFKAGVYNQNNTGTASDYAQATFYSLIHTHP